MMMFSERTVRIAPLQVTGGLTSVISVWAATCKDPRYIQLHGYLKTAENQTHKQEVLAFNMAKHLEQRASTRSQVATC